MSIQKLDFSNTPQIVFQDPELRSKLPEFKPYFDSWLLSVRVPSLRLLGKRAVLDFLSALKPEHLSIISDRLGCEVEIIKLDYHIVKEVKSGIHDVEFILNESEWYSNFALTRDKENVSISFWR